MKHENRGRLTVDINGKWRLYQPISLPGWQVIGTVTRGDSDTGALACNQQTGLYAQINAGTIRSLDQRKVKAALNGA